MASPVVPHGNNGYDPNPTDNAPPPHSPPTHKMDSLRVLTGFAGQLTAWVDGGQIFFFLLLAIAKRVCIAFRTDLSGLRPQCSIAISPAKRTRGTGRVSPSTTPCSAALGSCCWCSLTTVSEAPVLRMCGVS